MRYTVLLFMGFGLFAYGGKYKPIYNSELSYDKSIALEKVEKAVKKSLIGRGWRVKEATPGKITAKIRLRSHTAIIEIAFGKGNLTITYKDSTNLGYRVKKGEKRIHRNYNNWILNLERDIEGHLLL